MWTTQDHVLKEACLYSTIVPGIHLEDVLCRRGDILPRFAH